MEYFDAANAVPEGWVADAGEWSVVHDETTSSPPNALLGKGEGESSTLRAPARFAAFEALLRMGVAAGDEAAGVVFWYSSADHRAIQYSPRENAWEYIRVEAGQASTLERTPAVPDKPGPADGWITLRIQAGEGRVQAWQDGVLVIDHQEADRRPVGSFGLHLRGHAQARFDSVEVEPRTT